MSAKPAFQTVLRLDQTAAIRYPVPRPTEPPPPAAPPAWTRWPEEFGTPSFSPPYYRNSFTFLNRFVTSAYSEEFRSFASANGRRLTIIELNKTRNADMAGLAAEAHVRWIAAKQKQDEAFESEVVAQYRRDETAFLDAAQQYEEVLKDWKRRVEVLGFDGLHARIDLTIRSLDLPPIFSDVWCASFDEDSGILVFENEFPNLDELTVVKTFEQNGNERTKDASQRERRDVLSRLWPALSVRLACELARLDSDNIVKAVVVNGWTEFVEKATGHGKRAYCSSLFALKDQVEALNIEMLDPIAAFRALKGIAAADVQVAPIQPVCTLDTDDPRFVEAQAVLTELPAGENLAAMDWEQFEHLCRELFERAFAAAGAQVKVTRASRDQGVDAVVFDPDPIRGGKIIIQAKRYTNLVEVSAVRDLYGSVINEGALKGILVTTSSFGPESYAFAKDKPLRLMNGREMLGLLEQYGYRFRIDLVEAKELLRGDDFGRRRRSE